MDPFPLTKFEPPLSGGPDMRVRRLMIAATLFANAVRAHGERFLREVAALLGKEADDLTDEMTSSEEFEKLVAAVGSKGNAIYVMRLAEVVGEAREGLEIEDWYGITEAERQALRDLAVPPFNKDATEEQLAAWDRIPGEDVFKKSFYNTTKRDEAGAAAAALVSGTRDAKDGASTTSAEGQPTAGNVPDADASGGAAVSTTTDVSHPTQAAAGGGSDGSGTTSTPAAGSDAASKPGSTPGVASGPAAGGGPSSPASSTDKPKPQQQQPKQGGRGRQR